MTTDLRELIDDPLRFHQLCWPQYTLYDKQAETMLSVRDNIETFVHAGNELGKTRIAAETAIWFYASRTPCRVITSSSSEKQVKKILWSEIKALLRASRFPFPFKLGSLEINKFVMGRDGKVDRRRVVDDDYLIGQVTSSVENFHGHHLPNDKARVLWICDEASGVDDEYDEAADSWMHRKLVIGNPMNTVNFFFRSCKMGNAVDPADPGGDSKLRNVIHISGDDSPNVKYGKLAAKHRMPFKKIIPGLLSYEEYLRRMEKWDPIKRTIRLFGKFYEGEERLLFPMLWLDLAEELHKIIPREARRPEVLGVDVSGGGRDLTVWALADRWGIIELIEWQEFKSTMEISGNTINLMKKHRIPPSNVWMDAGGGGKQIGDRLIELGHNINVVPFGAGADDKDAYVNTRAELYGVCRELARPRFESDVVRNPDGTLSLAKDARTPGESKTSESEDGISDTDITEEGLVSLFTLPENEKLREELSILPLQYDSEGRMWLPKKEKKNKDEKQPTLRSILGRSPDRADAVVLAARGISKRPVVPRQITAYEVKVDPERVKKLHERVEERLAKIRSRAS